MIQIRKLRILPVLHRHKRRPTPEIIAARHSDAEKIVISEIVSDSGVLPDNVIVPNDNSERPYITLRTQGKDTNIVCTFPPNREYAVMGLHNGQPVIFEGLLYTTDSKSGVRIWVTNSSIVKPEGIVDSG